MLDFPTWKEAHTWAEKQANKYQIAHGIEKRTSMGKGWRVFMLPKPENRQGHELTCEAVEPTNPHTEG